MSTDPRLSLSTSVQMKVNLGNYESVDVFVAISGVTQETTREEVDALLNGPGIITWEALKTTLRTRVLEIRNRRQEGRPS